MYPKHLARLAASLHAIIPFPEVSKSLIRIGQNGLFSDWLTSKASLKAAIWSFVNSVDILNSLFFLQNEADMRFYMGKIVGKVMILFWLGRSYFMSIDIFKMI